MAGRGQWFRRNGASLLSHPSSILALSSLVITFINSNQRKIVLIKPGDPVVRSDPDIPQKPKETLSPALGAGSGQDEGFSSICLPQGNVRRLYLNTQSTHRNERSHL